MPRITFAWLCAAALAVLPACGSTGQEVPDASMSSTGSSSADSATSESSSESESTSASDTTPPPETSGTESARPPQSEQPSLTVASLPIGANADEGCLTIRFLRAASEVPADMRLVVTRVLFKPEAIEFGGSGCSGMTHVCGDGLVLTESGSDECSASITTSDAGAVGTQVEVQVAATVDCAGGHVAACVRFKERLESDEDSVGIATISVPEPPQPETSPTVEPPSPLESPSSFDSGTTASS
jgi:hypothetical protein